MDRTSLHPDFSELLKLLTSHGAEFLVIGGYALIYHGYTRYTDDFVVWISSTPENVEKVLSALEEFAFPGGLERAGLLVHGKMVRIGVPPRRIEVLTSISGIEFAEAYPHKEMCEADGFTFPVISMDLLIKNKLASGRPQDLADVDALRKIQLELQRRRKK